MRLPRPYIPLAVRCQVAERQLREDAAASALQILWSVATDPSLSLMSRLGQLVTRLKRLLDADDLQLDHNPALALRKFNKRTGKYTPDANDPAYLIYRAKDAHRTKTFIRGEHGQRSDVAQIKRERRRARPKKPKRKIQSRPFQKRRKP